MLGSVYKNKPINQVSEAVCREYWKWDAVFSVHSQYWLTLVIYVLELITTFIHLPVIHSLVENVPDIRYIYFWKVDNLPDNCSRIRSSQLRFPFCFC